MALLRFSIVIVILCGCCLCSGVSRAFGSISMIKMVIDNTVYYVSNVLVCLFVHTVTKVSWSTTQGSITRT